MAAVFDRRRAGVLLHPTSLPSAVLDQDVERWLDMLAACGSKLWQVLPLGEPQEDLSPYNCLSAFAMNPALLADTTSLEFSDDELADFEQQQPWLRDYVLFKLLRRTHSMADWSSWPAQFRDRDADALQSFQQSNANAYRECVAEQLALRKRWREIRERANSQDILLFGDMPLFVSHDSADVWANQELFRLDEQGHMNVVTGVPPDYYSETGQRWGNPHYDWDRMRSDGFEWWQRRVGGLLEQFDIVRIDHFRGLEASWVIDAEEETAINGRWERMPGDELLQQFMTVFGDIPVVAEDLGFITQEVTDLRHRFSLPGMSVLQFGFDEHADNPHRATNITEDRVVYTGTHDNDTTVGWFLSLDAHTRGIVCETLDVEMDADEARLAADVADAMIGVAMRSAAALSIVPLQDVIGLDSASRMNVPGVAEGNWRWQFDWDQIEQVMLDRLHEHIEAGTR